MKIWDPSHQLFSRTDSVYPFIPVHWTIHHLSVLKHYWCYCRLWECALVTWVRTLCSVWLLIHAIILDPRVSSTARYICCRPNNAIHVAPIRKQTNMPIPGRWTSWASQNAWAASTLKYASGINPRLPSAVNCLARIESHFTAPLHFSVHCASSGKGSLYSIKFW